jgi:hypothetical protein
MKITFNDGQELQIQQVTEQTDGALLIKDHFSIRGSAEDFIL